MESRGSRKLKTKYILNISNNNLTTKETIKQNVQLKALRIRRFEKRKKKKNLLAKPNTKKFYREVDKETIILKEPPSKEFEIFWKGIWSKEKENNKNVERISNTELCSSGPSYTLERERVPF